jgi:hypothetical protein
LALGTWYAQRIYQIGPALSAQVVRPLLPLALALALALLLAYSN